MNRFQHFSEARAAYENVPIPDGLEARVQEGIRQGRAARALRQRRRVRRWACAAACFAALFAGLNLSPAVANAAAGVPVLGRLFRVLTVVRFEKSENGIDYAVDVPAVDAEGDLAKTVNDMIQAKVDLHMEKARQDWQDYQDAFFATGTAITWTWRRTGPSPCGTCWARTGSASATQPSGGRLRRAGTKMAPPISLPRSRAALPPWTRGRPSTSGRTACP